MRYLLKSVVVLVVLFAIAISAARWYAPYWLESNRQFVLDSLSEKSGYQISAESFESHWYRSGPVITLKQLRLQDKQNSTTLFRADSVALHLSLVDLLRYRNFVPTSTLIGGLQLTLIRQQNGELRMYGHDADAAAATNSDSDLTRLLFQPERLALRHTRITFVDLTGDRRVTLFSPADLTLQNNGNKHLLSGKLGIDRKERGELNLSAEFITDSERPGNWSGKLYLLTSELDLGWLFGDRIPGHYRVNSGSSNFEIWSDWNKGLLTSLNGRVSAKQISLGSPDHAAPELEIDWASSRFSWQKESHGWRLDLANTRISDKQQTWPTTALSLALRRTGDEAPPTLFVGADKLDIGRLLDALAFRPLESQSLHQLIALKPTGTLSRLQASLRMARPLQWHLKAGIENFSTTAVDEIPAVENFNAVIDADHQGGQLHILAENALFHAPKLFRNSLQLEQVTGDIGWRQHEGQWQFGSDALTISNPHLATVSAFRLLTADDAKPSLSFLCLFKNGDASAASLYYPVGIMDEEVVSWLDRGIGDGKVISGSAYVDGPLDDFPFHTTGNGRFDTKFQVADLTLDYLEDWPPIHHLGANVHFHGNSLTIDSDSGKIYGSNIQHVTAKIDRFIGLTPLAISGSVEGEAKDLQQLLQEAPLKSEFSRLTDHATLSGTTKTAIDLVVPLNSAHPATQIEGTLSLRNNRLQLRDSAFQVEAINGQLHLTDDGLEGEKIGATILNRRLTIDVAPDKKGGALFTSSTEISLDDLKKSTPSLAAIPASGESLWNIQLAMPPLQSSATPRLTASSSLSGTRVNLPLSLEKSTKTKRSTTIRFAPGDSRSGIDIDYGDARIKMAPSGQSGTIHSPLIRGAFSLPANSNTPFTADLDYLRLAFDSEQSVANKEKAGRPQEIPSLRLQSRELIINQIPFGSMQLETKRSKEGMEITKLAVGEGDTSLTGKGSWHYRNKAHHTRIEAKLTAKNLGSALKGLGLTEQMEGSSGTLNANLHWNNALSRFTPAKLSGTISIAADKGRLNDTKPGIGRLIGLANLRALQRRLSLDFSDFTKEGFAYDEIIGSATIDSGIATTKNLQIKAPAGVIEIRGTTNLATKELDQRIKVLPEIHGALPVAGTLAGGPAVGAALLIAGAVAGDKIDRIAQTNYKVSGDWNNPTIERLDRKGNVQTAPQTDETGNVDSHGIPEID